MAVINDYKLDELTQYKFTVLQFSRLEVQPKSHSAEILVLAGLHSLPEFLGKNHFLAFSDY